MPFSEHPGPRSGIEPLVAAGESRLREQSRPGMGLGYLPKGQIWQVCDETADLQESTNSEGPIV